MIWAGVLGVLATLPLGRISIEVWLVVTSTWLALSIVLQLMAISPTEPARFRALWYRRTSEELSRTASMPRDLLALEGTLISARDNDRAYGLRLRPRLKRVTDHYLSSHHGIDADRDRDRANELLGDLAWMVDTEVDGRTPELDDIDRLLDLVVGSSSDQTFPSETADHQSLDSETTPDMETTIGD